MSEFTPPLGIPHPLAFMASSTVCWSRSARRWFSAENGLSVSQEVMLPAFERRFACVEVDADEHVGFGEVGTDVAGSDLVVSALVV